MFSTGKPRAFCADYGSGWSDPGTDIEAPEVSSGQMAQTDDDIEIGLPLHERAPARAMPGTCATLCAALRSGGGKLIEQTVTAGAGELAGAGLRIGVNALAATPTGAAVALGLCLYFVAAAGGLSGMRSAELVEKGAGGGPLVKFALTWAPVVVPLATALNSGIGSWSLAAAAMSLGGSSSRILSAGLRDGLNAVVKGWAGQAKVVDHKGERLSPDQSLNQHGTVGNVMSLPLNFGAAALVRFGVAPGLEAGTGYALHPELFSRASPGDQFRSYLIGAASGGFGKGLYGLMGELGRAGAVLGQGQGLAYEAGGLDALWENLKDTKSWGKKLEEVGDNAAMRITFAAITGESMSAIEKSFAEGSDERHAARWVTTLMEALGESRKLFVERGQLGEKHELAQPQTPPRAQTPEDAGPVPLVSQMSQMPQQLPIRQTEPGSLLIALDTYSEREDDKESCGAGQYPDLPVTDYPDEPDAPGY